jgi:hypothetical protein
MPVPSPIALLSAVSNAVDTVELRHAEPTSTPGIIGFRYFRSTVSLAAVVALAQADITAGGLASPAGILADAASPTILGKIYSRPHIPATVYFNDLPGAYGSVYYAAVVWNADGPSNITSAVALHQPATSPAWAAIVALETSIQVVFDQPVVAPTNRPGEGFTFLVNGAPRYSNTATQTDPSTVTFQMAGTISDNDTVVVSYDASVSNLTNATGANFAAAFTGVKATNQSAHAALLAVVCALDINQPEVITLLFSQPVTSIGGYANGLSVTANNVAVTFTSIAQGQDPRQLRVIFPGGFQYRDELMFSYAAASGDWVSGGYPIRNLIEQVVTNASRLGTPTDDYPLSSVVREQLNAKTGGIEATVGVDLNLIDQRLVDRFGPAMVDFGGVFGQTVLNPAGVFLPQDMRAVKAGISVSKRFLVPNKPQWAADAAAEWLNTMTQRIGTALGVLRTQDQQVVLGNRTVRQV